jgi:hypothetical protein
VLPSNWRRPAEWSGRGLEAVAAYRALLGAIHAHIKTLPIHANRLEVVAASSPGDPRDAAAAQLVRGLTAFAYLPGLLRYTVEGTATAWGAATTSLRAATDLLTTHRNFDGAIGTPDALQLEDPTSRAAGLTGIGDLTCTVLRAEWDLALRAGQAGMAREDLDRLLPDLSPLQPTVRALIAAGGTDDPTFPSLELGKAPAVRYGEVIG